MSLHTSFRIGGPADMLVVPRSAEELLSAYRLLLREAVPLLILGAGANILVADEGIRGAVLDLKEIRGCTVDRGRGQTPLLRAWAGTPISEASALAAEHGLSGLEFVYAMPGSVGGSVWMNARCYGGSVADVLEEVEYLDASGRRRRLRAPVDGFGYKRSPFQTERALILKASFSLGKARRETMRERMESIRGDREAKGHFLFPCAGSIFKNNRAFGRPTGALIDSLGLKGARVGDAQVSERHGNIIVNTGNARAADVLELIRLLEAQVHAAFGFALEREILLVGRWPEEAT